MTATTSPSDSATSEDDTQPTSIERVACALIVLAIGLVVLLGAGNIRNGGGFQTVGPDVFPRMVGAGATVCGVVLVFQAIRPVLRRERSSASRQASPRWWRVLALLGLLVAYALVLVPAGFWQASGLMFAATARLFGSRRWVRDLAVGFGLALAVYFLFDWFLQVNLPDGYIRIAG